MKKLVLLFCILLTGCGGSQTEGVQNRANAIISDRTTNNYKRESPYINRNCVDAPEDFDEHNQLTEQRSEKIAKNVSALEKVDKAFVTINGNSCIVAIEISDINGDEELIELKSLVKEKVISVDKDLEHVAVTISKELTENLYKGGESKDKSPVSPKSEAGKLIDQLTPAF